MDTKGDEMKFIIFLLPALLFSQTEVICVDGFKYIKFTQYAKTIQVLPKLIYHIPSEVQTKVGWRIVTETLPGYTEHEKCEVSK